MRKKILMNKWTSCYIIPLLFLSALLADDGKTSPLDVVAKVGEGVSMNWATKVIRVKGRGFGPGSVTDLGERKLLAKRAAQLDAYRNLLETVKGVQVTYYSDIKDMMRKSNTVYAKTSGMVRGMRLVAVTYSNDGCCTVIMEVDIDREGKFLLRAFSTGEITIEDNYPVFDWIKARKDLETLKAQRNYYRTELARVKEGIQEKKRLKKIKRLMESKNYTGLLVDARGVELKPVLAPSILNSGKQKMYGLGAIPAKLTGGAIVSYLHGNLESAKKRKEIGDNPLVVKCVEVVNKSDIIISDNDAQMVTMINKLLEQKKVAILI